MAEGYAEVDKSVKERPVIFGAPMVRALLAGTKTQTRRIVKNADWLACLSGDCPHERQSECDASLRAECPFGVPGDRLWVREKWSPSKKAPMCQVAYEADGKCVGCGGDGAGGYLQVFHGWLFPDVKDKGPARGRNLYESWKPSIHMPRWASRITLEITDVRVERLAEISEEDAAAEGVGRIELSPGPVLGEFGGKPMRGHPMTSTHEHAFRELWHTIHAADGPHGWEANPWLWVISFRRVG